MGSLVRLLRERMRMMREDALAVSQVVEQAFRGADAIEDDELDSQIRQLFYDLQDAHVLDVERHEYKKDGQLLRGYRWHVVDKDLANDVAPVRREADPMASLYGSLEDKAWERREPTT